MPTRPRNSKSVATSAPSLSEPPGFDPGILRRVRRPPVPNSGSLARDHLANERTFLAWVRTALGVVGLGVLLEKFVATGEEVIGTVAGLAIILMGGVSLIFAIVRYERVRRLLDDGAFEAAATGPLLVAAVSLIIAVAAVVFVIL